MAGVALWLLSHNGLSWRQVGLGRLTIQQFWVGLALGAALFGGSLLIEQGVAALLPALLPKPLLDRIGGSGTEQIIGTAFLREGAPWLRAALILAGAGTAPLCEELLFRGCFQTLLSSRLESWYSASGAKTVGSLSRPNSRIALWGSVTISALLFAVAHVSPPAAVVTAFCLGVALSAAYRRTGTLWTPILMHSTNNVLTFTLLLASRH